MRIGQKSLDRVHAAITPRSQHGLSGQVGYHTGTVAEPLRRRYDVGS